MSKQYEKLKQLEIDKFKKSKTEKIEPNPNPKNEDPFTTAYFRNTLEDLYGGVKNDKDVPTPDELSSRKNVSQTDYKIEEFNEQFNLLKINYRAYFGFILLPLIIEEFLSSCIL